MNVIIAIPDEEVPKNDTLDLHLCFCDGKIYSIVNYFDDKKDYTFKECKYCLYTDKTN